MCVNSCLAVKERLVDETEYDKFPGGLRGRADPGQRPHRALVQGGAIALRAVIDHPQPMRLRDRIDRSVIGRLAVQIDRDDADRL